MEGETVGLGDVFEYFNGSRGVRGIRFLFVSLFERVHLMKRGIVP